MKVINRRSNNDCFNLKTMRKLVILLLLLTAVTTTDAQIMKKGIVKKSVDRTNAIVVGLKGGINLPYMDYTDPNLSSLPHDTLLKPIGGIFVEIPVRDYFSVAPELMYMQRGTATSFYNRDSVWTDYDMNYHSVELRVPCIFSYKVNNWFQPYAFVGPDFGYVLGGNIIQDRTQNGTQLSHDSIGIGSSNINKFHFSVLGGVGMRFNINFSTFTLVTKLEAAYNYGILDTYSRNEHVESSDPTNVNAYNTTGYRYSKGLECCLSIGIPLRFAGKDACAAFAKDNDSWR